MLDTGYPRNDLLSDPHKEEKAKELKKKVGIPLDKKSFSMHQHGEMMNIMVMVLISSS